MFGVQEIDHFHVGSEMPSHDIIVIGASAGGVQAVLELARELPANLPAAVFVVIHTSAGSSGILPGLIHHAGSLAAAYAEHGERVRLGRIYVARPDYHLLLQDREVHLSHGPRENGFRPAADPLFRTAARAYGPRVVGVVLTGGLDDGTAGLREIKRLGGVALVQDPGTAVQASMPESAIRNVKVDQVLPVSRMAAALAEYASVGRALGPPRVTTGGAVVPRKKGARRPDVVEAVDLGMNSDDLPGAPSGFVCPECGGAMWGLTDGKLVKYRCHVGHSFTADGLFNEQQRSLENVLWTALRALEERAALARRLADRVAGAPVPSIARHYEQQARDAEERAALLREVLLSDRIRSRTPGVRAAAGGRQSNLSRKQALRRLAKAKDRRKP